MACTITDFTDLTYFILPSRKPLAVMAARQKPIAVVMIRSTEMAVVTG